jgi:hypothetical protein
MKFDLNNYETVKERKKRFYADYPDGRIICNIEHCNLEYAVIKTILYKNKEEQKEGLIYATGNALELHDTELKKSKYGKEYESVNYSSWLENAEESSIGRALDNAGYSGNNKCSKEEIIKSQKNSKVQHKIKQLQKEIQDYALAKELTEKQQNAVNKLNTYNVQQLKDILQKIKTCPDIKG